MISDWIFAFSLQPGWRLTRNPMAVHGLFMKQVMAVENPWNIYLQTLGNQFVEYESVLADHSIPAHACTCTNSFGSIPSPKCWLFSRNEPAGNTHFVAIWTNLHLWFADSGLWKTNIFPIFPSPGGFPIGKIKHHLKQTQTRHPWRRKKMRPVEFSAAPSEKEKVSVNGTWRGWVVSHHGQIVRGSMAKPRATPHIVSLHGGPPFLIEGLVCN